jgi:large exoprotein involved in heme utilization and adhesion
MLPVFYEFRQTKVFESNLSRNLNILDLALGLYLVNIQASGAIDLDNRAEITTLSLGSGGTIDLTAKVLHLKNATINTQTASGNGGEIFLNVSNATLLCDRSLLSTEARSLGNGGDIRIRSPFIVGLENSDIIANAFAGRGGNIVKLYRLQHRLEPHPSPLRRQGEGTTLRRSQNPRSLYTSYSSL